MKNKKVIDSATGKKEASKLKQRYGIPRPVKAIRDKCLDCCGGQEAEVRRCVIPDCPLYPYRFGRTPKEPELKVHTFDKYGEHVGFTDYVGYMKSED